MKLRTSAIALVITALSAAGCDEQQTSLSGKPGEQRDVGVLRGALELPDDTEILAVEFTISHPSGYVGPGPNSSLATADLEPSPREGTIPVDNSTILTFRIGNLLVQDGYTLHLEAVTEFGNTCTVDRMFDIEDNGVTTLLNVVLVCTAQDNAGDLVVNGEFQSCPLVTALQAIPAEVILGNDIALQAWISHGDSDVVWSGMGGDFDPDTGYVTTFTCATAGSFTLTAAIDGLSGALSACDDTATLDVTCTLGAGCGNMQLDSGEQCDDGNTGGGDDCTGTCRTNVCGDGDVDMLAPVVEGCDDGNTLTEGCAYGAASCTVCDSTCTSVAGDTDLCGDSTTDSPTETCDDGNAVTEECPYGVTSCTVCNASCQSVAGDTDVCGDSTTDAGEGCDDGNTVSGDGCSATCTVEVDDCSPCRTTNCSSWFGVNVFQGCMSLAGGSATRTLNGADHLPDEMTFVQQCVDTVNCGRATNCAYGAQAVTDGPFAACYCGSRNPTDCQSMGPAADANTIACRSHWETVTRSTAPGVVFGVYGDYTLPAGWASELLSCSFTRCRTQCDGIP